jgi:hypothetical protein
MINHELPAIRAKADPSVCDGKDRFSRGKARGYSKICSQHSEDRLTWIFFRSLERSGHTAEFLKWCFPTWQALYSDNTPRWFYWGRKAQQIDIDADVRAALGVLEPDQQRRGTQHTETDAAVRMPMARIMVEAKLGNQSGKTGWEKSGQDPKIREQYYEHAKILLKHTESQNWQQIVREFYQPMRNLMLCNVLEKGDLRRVGLLLVVNARQGTPKRANYDDKFRQLRNVVSISESQLQLYSWHDLVSWARQLGTDLKIAIDTLQNNPLLKADDDPG